MKITRSDCKVSNESKNYWVGMDKFAQVYFDRDINSWAVGVWQRGRAGSPESKVFVHSEKLAKKMEKEMNTPPKNYKENIDLLKSAIREAILIALQEMTTTGAVAGYDAPFAFSRKTLTPKLNKKVNKLPKKKKGGYKTIPQGDPSGPSSNLLKSN